MKANSLEDAARYAIWKLNGIMEQNGWTEDRKNQEWLGPQFSVMIDRLEEFLPGKEKK